MKASKYLSALAVLTSVGLSGLASSSAQEVPYGSLEVDRGFVRAATSPNVTWDITHPVDEIEEVIEITPPNEVTPKVDLNMQVRVLGASYAPYGNFERVQGLTRHSGGSNYEDFFFEREDEVDPTHIYYEEIVEEDKNVYFAARAYIDTYRYGWTSAHLTSNNSDNIAVLKNGDTPPTYAPAFQQGNIETFLRPYLTNGKVDIGPRDLIILFELSNTLQPGHSGFDMQDLVLLVTFEDVEVAESSSNNGGNGGGYGHGYGGNDDDDDDDDDD